MKFLLSLLSVHVCIAFTCEAQVNHRQKHEQLNKYDHVIDTTVTDGRHFIHFYRPAGSFAIDLDHDNVMDTIQWDDFMFQIIETGVTERDMGGRIHVVNTRGELIHAGDWGPVDKKMIKFQDPGYRSDNDRILFASIANNATALILPRQLYASDVDAYTIIAVNSQSRPAVVFDDQIILTALEDLDADGFVELIGKHPNAGIPEYTNCFVPFQVLKYAGSLTLNLKLTYKYNLPYKKYREYPEGSICLLQDNDLEKYTAGQLRIMRNEIFADHGHVFESKDLRDYFLKKDWYKPLPGRSFILTDWEKQNIETMKRCERKARK